MGGKTSVLESLFNSEYCEIFESTYFQEWVGLSKNVDHYGWPATKNEKKNN